MNTNTTDTPETDAAERLYSERQHHYAVRDLCRKMERERDAALRELASLRADKARLEKLIEDAGRKMLGVAIRESIGGAQ